jgi:hypothetical protein
MQLIGAVEALNGQIDRGYKWRLLLALHDLRCDAPIR